MYNTIITTKTCTRKTNNGLQDVGANQVNAKDSQGHRIKTALLTFDWKIGKNLPDKIILPPGKFNLRK